MLAEIHKNSLFKKNFRKNVLKKNPPPFGVQPELEILKRFLCTNFSAVFMYKLFCSFYVFNSRRYLDTCLEGNQPHAPPQVKLRTDLRPVRRPKP